MSGQSWYLSLGLGNIVTADFNPGLEEGLGKVVNVNAEQMGHLLGDSVVGKDCLVRVPLLAELHVAEEQHAGDDPPDGAQVLVADAHDLHGLDGGLELLGIVDSGNGDTSLAEECVVLGVFENVFL